MITYKEMNINDIDEIIPMYIESFNSPPWNDKWTKQTAYKRIHAMINVEDFYGLCAYKDNTICGMILGCKEQFYDGIMFNLREFCVRNSLRGNGLGTRILQELESRLKAQNVSTIILNTIRGKMTDEFYKKNGYKLCSNMVVLSRQII